MNFHHFYSASASAQPEGNVKLDVEGLQSLESAAPKEFGGPGGQWSPEDLVAAAVADCFVLSFRAIAAASKFAFKDIQCTATGELDKADTGVQFVGFKVEAKLTVDADADQDRAANILKKAKGACFITNSLKAPAELETQIVVG